MWRERKAWGGIRGKAVSLWPLMQREVSRSRRTGAGCPCIEREGKANSTQALPYIRSVTYSKSFSRPILPKPPNPTKWPKRRKETEDLYPP